MRRGVLCVLMTGLLLLSACGAEGGVSPEEELALTIRGEYLAMAGCTAQLSVTADYGQRVYEFDMDAAVTGEETVLTLTAPDTVAGIAARVTGETGALEYDGLILDTGELGPDGLSPMSAFPALLTAAKSGFLTACAMEEREGEELLRVTCGAPDAAPGEGVETVLWFRPDTHELAGGEIWAEGLRVICCQCKNFRATGQITALRREPDVVK